MVRPGGYTKYNGRYGYVLLGGAAALKGCGAWRRPESQGAWRKETSAVNQGDASDTQNSAAGEGQGTSAGTASTGSSQAQSGEVQGPPAADGTTEGGKSADEAVTKPVNGTAATSFKEENSWYKSPFYLDRDRNSTCSNRNSGLSFEETLIDKPDQYKKSGEFCEEITACQEEITAASFVCGSCGQPGSGHGSRCGRLQ